MNKLLWVCAIAFFCVVAIASFGQQVDVAIGGGTISAPAEINNASTGTFAASLRGGTYIGFSGDALFLMNGHSGVQGEVFWRGSRGSYAGQLPYRPLFWDFNAIYSRRFGKFVGAEALGGIGAESIRFYSSQFTNCDIYGNCSNYVSSNHFMADVGGGLKLYAYKNFFVRPEVRLYFVHNNVEFSSSRAVRYGFSIGYTFGGSQQ